MSFQLPPALRPHPPKIVQEIDLGGGWHLIDNQLRYLGPTAESIQEKGRGVYDPRFRPSKDLTPHKILDIGGGFAIRDGKSLGFIGPTPAPRENKTKEFFNDVGDVLKKIPEGAGNLLKGGAKLVGEITGAGAESFAQTLLPVILLVGGGFIIFKAVTQRN